ncbi:MAG: DsbA family oxidoreductase [Actinomycetota bacterium]|nr:DsbA family oxidoreductase [Actinomycetota bacterium]
MKIEIWSDVACPWCYVGLERFERAVAETGIEVEVEYRPFELDPNVPLDGPELEAYLARKFGDKERVRAAHARLTEAGEELGIDFQWKGMRRRNTFDAHRLLNWTLHTFGPAQQHALKRRLLVAHFTEGRDVADRDVLSDLAGEVGIDRDDARALLDSDEQRHEVQASRDEAYTNGIQAVPTYVIEGQWMLQGALETDKWVRALRTIERELAEAEPAS